MENGGKMTRQPVLLKTQFFFLCPGVGRERRERRASELARHTGGSHTGPFLSGPSDFVARAPDKAPNSRAGTLTALRAEGPPLRDHTRKLCGCIEACPE